ncbi:MAG: DUF2860 domain-containing protein, partial [Aquificaceae bacterium]|nr:DUF2860 domain-containing protein [Aquificaceae bacterium]
MRKVWKDPYLLLQERGKTYQRDYEAGFNFWHGSISLGLKLLYSDVEEDDLGSRVPSLKRDRLLASIRTSYRQYIKESASLTPFLNLDYSHAKGDASSYAGYSLRLVGSRRYKSLLFNASISLGQDFYKKSNPIFGRRVWETKHAIFFNLTKLNLLHPSLY